MNIFTYDTPLGQLSIVDNDTYITHVFFNQKFKFKTATIRETPLIKKTYSQICEYLDGQRTTFDIPMTFYETEFAEKVRKVIQSIPYGSTIAYKSICQSINQPKVWRAVGHTVRTSRIAILIPLHRVLGIDGKIIGSDDDTIINEELLKIEGKSVIKC